MIGAGTGAAPFRAFVQERARLKEIGREVGITILCLGFRKPDEDFLYAEEWAKYQAVLGNEFKLWTAFSREDHEKRVYVQDRLEQHATLVLETMERDDNARMYICGSAAMARDVVSCLARIWSRKNSGSQEATAEWLRMLQQSGRLRKDIWG
jgi:NADPH-ferrihemoprotein reductase